MFKNVLTKTLYEKRWMLLAWSLGMFAMTLFTMIFYPYLKNSGFDEIARTAPKSLQKLLGDSLAYKTVPGYVGQQIFALRMPLMAIIMAVAVFSSASAGDENRGTLETLLAQPIARGQVFWQRFIAGTLLVGVACATIALAVLVSFPIIHGSMSLGRLAEATFGCWLISMVFGAITYAVGAATGRKGLTIGFASGLAFMSYLVSSLAPAVDKLDFAQKITPFYYYNTPVIADQGLQAKNVLLLLAVIAVTIMAGYSVFVRRDLVRED
jgi:ABC-2 type transport system permease protein